MDMVLRLIKVAGIALLMQPYLADGQGITKCTLSSDSCSCETNKGTIQLKSKDSPYPAPDTHLTQYSYLWDPCKDFSAGGITAGAIQQYVHGPNLEIGVHRLAFSGVLNGYAIFSMKSTDGSRTTNVKCVCGSGDTFVYESEGSGYNYNFRYTSNDCCPGSSGNTVTLGISVGTVLVIIFFSLLAAYLLFGTLFQVFVRKAQGRERIPNVNLWSALPGLIKDGFVCLFTRGRRSGYTKT